MSAQSPGRIILANIVSDQMFADPPLDYAERMCAVTPRKIWRGHPGDMIITPVEISPAFIRYAEEIRRIDLSTIECLTPAGDPRLPLAMRVASDADILERVKAYIASHPATVLSPFCTDSATVRLVGQLGIPLEGYSPEPSADTLEACYRINTKSGFRDVATSLGLPMIPGRRCERDGLLRAVTEIGAAWPAVHVKADRSSNGYGHAVISTGDGGDISRQVGTITSSPTAPDAFMVERHLDFVALPSVEIRVTDGGAEVSYICDMRCTNSVWTGMITPPENFSRAVNAELMEIGRRFGRWAWDVGYRGVCDLDCGVTADDTVWVNESNFRRTGGTYLHGLVKSLVGPDYLHTHVWTADVKLGGLSDFSVGRDAVRAAGLQFDHARREGVVLTADTLKFDNKWRYLILARSHDAARRFERDLIEVLRISDEAPVQPVLEEADQ